MGLQSWLPKDPKCTREAGAWLCYGRRVSPAARSSSWPGGQREERNLEKNLGTENGLAR